MANRVVRDENDAGVLRLDVDMGDGTHAERYIGQPPAFLLTGTTNPRMRVDVGQTGFFEGREFRTFREFSVTAGTQIPAGQRMLFRAVIAVNTILMSLDFAGDSGQIRVRTFVGGTPTGAFSETLPIIKANAMTVTPAYTGVNAIHATAPGNAAAVDLTGGTQLDVLRLKVENATAQESSVGETADSERGLAPSTYYILVENIGSGAFEGTMHARFEERP